MFPASLPVFTIWSKLDPCLGPPTRRAPDNRHLVLPLGLSCLEMDAQEREDGTVGVNFPRVDSCDDLGRVQEVEEEEEEEFDEVEQVRECSLCLANAS